jgi:RNA polymerase sigma-70 factor (ECF subfamily)
LNGELHVELERAIDAVPKPLCVEVEIHNVEQLSTEQTAERLGLTPGATLVSPTEDDNVRPSP